MSMKGQGKSKGMTNYESIENSSNFTHTENLNAARRITQAQAKIQKQVVHSPSKLNYQIQE